LSLVIAARLIKPEERFRPLKVVPLALLIAWLAVSALQPALQTKVHVDTRRFERMLQSSNPAARGKAFGLSLSGGGYRAAVYHAGVLRGIEDVGYMPTHLVTVSGGSIIGSFYAMGGDPTDFRDAVAKGVFNLRRELALAQNLLRLPMPNVSRLTVQADILRRTLLHTAQPTASAPKHMVAMTDLNFGMQLGLVDRKFLILDPHNDEYWRIGEAGSVLPDRATLAAISGALPGAFPVYSVRLSTSGEELRQLQLADGGIADNTGNLLLEAARVHLEGWALDVHLASNAGAVPGYGKEVRGLEALWRSISILERAPAFPRQHKCEPRRYLPVSPALLCVIDKRDLFDMRTGSFSERERSGPLNVGWFIPLLHTDQELRGIVGVVASARRLEALERFLLTRQRALGSFPWDSKRLLHVSAAVQQTTPDNGCGARRERLPILDPDSEALRCATVELQNAVRPEVQRLCDRFITTPTLDDQLDDDQVDDIFRLGRLQALMASMRHTAIVTKRPLIDPNEWRRIQGLPDVPRSQDCPHENEGMG